MTPQPKQTRTTRPAGSPWIPYAAPFALFVAITGLAKYFPESRDIFYIAKTIVAGAMLWIWRRRYTRDLSPELPPAGYLTALAAGLLVLFLWVAPERLLPQIGTSTGFNPYDFGWPPKAVPLLIAIRLVGAVLVVPVMEELFWRSFIMRYAIHPEFQKIPLGAFTLFSFAATAILFGLEHFRVIPGILAGIVYALLVIQQKTLKGSILAHATTNLGLGIYVLHTENWLFW